jgi:hypothetical protein
MLAALTDTLTGIRDWALLLIGFAGARRRSEPVAPDVEDVAFVSEGIVLMIRRSKTDQEASGAKVSRYAGHHSRNLPGRCSPGVAARCLAFRRVEFFERSTGMETSARVWPISPGRSLSKGTRRRPVSILPFSPGIHCERVWQPQPRLPELVSGRS